ncbi:hypothetical protein OJF2_36510 [Aquisphaera giovannonii]|uniref:Uncharacterized protein n=1 Tax=Aquisphaera giovannonii TaxID=406548 RepID=A0A5B9W3B7_9BACT|nr:hypothetical protein [Aquisphaera giovannonii]QEH35106.1 hypothetical protein OJF2_36510 [Aquisphaera giovannonii]
MVGFAWHRATVEGLFMPGLIVTTADQSIGSAIEDILPIAECMPEAEIQDRAVVFLPVTG